MIQSEGNGKGKVQKGLKVQRQVSDTLSICVDFQTLACANNRFQPIGALEVVSILALSC